jgi:hypothetical protein
MDTEAILRETAAYFEALTEQESEQDAQFSQDEGINLLIDSIFDNYTLESIQLDAVASLL